MKEYPVGHQFYKDKGLKHVEGKIPARIKKIYEQLADAKYNGSLVAAVSKTLIRCAPVSKQKEKSGRKKAR